MWNFELDKVNELEEHIHQFECAPKAFVYYNNKEYTEAARLECGVCDCLFQIPVDISKPVSGKIIVCPKCRSEENRAVFLGVCNN